MGNTIGKIEDVPKRAVSEVRASASQVSSWSDLPREKVELAFKLLEVSSRMLRILQCKSSSILIFLFLQEVLAREGSRSQDETELNALKERVKTLSSEKVSLEGKLKKLS